MPAVSGCIVRHAWLLTLSAVALVAGAATLSCWSFAGEFAPTRVVVARRGYPDWMLSTDLLHGFQDPATPTARRAAAVDAAVQAAAAWLDDLAVDDLAADDLSIWQTVQAAAAARLVATPAEDCVENFWTGRRTCGTDYEDDPRWRLELVVRAADDAVRPRAPAC